MSMADLRRRQPSPHAGLGFGAAGIAYTFVRAYEAGRGRDHLAAAQRWSAAAWRGRARRDAWYGVVTQGLPEPAAVKTKPSSLGFGRAGLSFVRALVASNTGGRAWNERTEDLISLA